jgi:hypothetical protein
MEDWRRLYQADINYEVAFYLQKAVENRARRTRRANKRARKRFIEKQLDGQSTIPNDDARWDDMLLITEDTDNAEDFSDEYI